VARPANPFTVLTGASGELADLLEPLTAAEEPLTTPDEPLTAAGEALTAPEEDG
jgi:hypothetical protein